MGAVLCLVPHGLIAAAGATPTPSSSPPVTSCEALARSAVPSPIPTDRAPEASARPIADVDSSRPTAGTPVAFAPRWTAVPPAPFGAEYGIAGWTGTSLIVVDPASGRTATWNGRGDGGWRERARAPFGRPVHFSPSVIAAGHLVVLAGDEGTPGAVMFDSTADAWTVLATPPIGPVVAAVWTGELVVAAAYGGSTAAYDPGTDCWMSLPSVPGAGSLVTLLWTGERVLADTRTPVESASTERHVAVAQLDPVTLTWTAGADAPFPIGHGHQAVWADGAVHYWSWAPRAPEDGDGGLDERVNARYDPVEHEWQPLEVECRTSAQGTVSTGDLLLATNGRLAFDASDGSCLELPRPPRRLPGRSAAVWTDDAFVIWSGTRTEAGPAVRDGLMLRTR